MKQIACKNCGQPFESTHGRKYCSPECVHPPAVSKICKTCGNVFRRRQFRVYCSYECRYKDPAVYRFVAPDGRSYVGAVLDSRRRAKDGVARSNARLKAAFKQYPPETFTFEVLEQLPRGCSEQELRAREQHHIDRLRSWSPDFGFNMNPAVWGAKRQGAES